MSRVFSFPQEKRGTIPFSTLINFFLETNSGRCDSPDPTAYDVINGMKAVKEHSPEWKFSKNMKGGNSGDNVPGPGQYDGDANKMKHNVAYNMGSKTPIQNHTRVARDQMPGPGSYEPTLPSKSPTFSMKGKINEPKPEGIPGPGAYYNQQQFGQNSRKAVMGERPKTARIDNQPGPGQYDAQNKTIGGDKSQRGASTMRDRGEKIASPNRFEREKLGPGAYDANPHAVRDKTPNFKFGTSSRDDIISKDEKLKPGPGAYEVKNLKSQRAIKIGQRLQQSLKNDVPGPGNYEPNHNFGKSSVRGVKIQRQLNKSSMIHSKSSNIVGPGEYYQDQDFGKNAKKVSIYGKPKQSKPLDIPGPGAYDASDRLIKAFTPSYKYGNSSRQDAVSKQVKEMPGPGQYNSVSHKQIGQDVPQFSIGKKSNRIERDLSPGPGAYQPNHNIIKDKTRNVNMGTSKRSDIASKTAKESPGPGHYQSPNKTIGPQYSMNYKRSDLKQTDTPGPGAYDASDEVKRDKSPSYKLGTGSRTQIISKSVLEQPGPGYYDQKTALGKGPQFSFQSRLDIKIKDDKPGPGNYEPNAQAVKDKVITYKMASSSRTGLVSRENIERPGPGQYTEYDQFGKNALKVSIHGRAEDKIRNDSPGPGAYEPINHLVKDKVRVYKIDSTSKRSEIVTKEMMKQPGPGEYDSPIRIGYGAYSVIIKGKPQDISRDDIPGPGQYDPQSHLVKDKVRAFKMDQSSRGDVVSKDQKNLPGPGIYEQPSTIGKNTYSFTMSVKANNNFDNKLPGPGSYEPNESPTKFQSPSIKIASGQKSQRGEFLSDEKTSMPGPGAYDQPSHIGKGRAVQIKGRANPERISNIPGPGQYDASDDIIKTRIQSAKIGTHKRDFLDIRNEDLQKPGPGYYDQKLPQNNITYSMGSKAHYNPRNDIPGPGAYDQKDKFTKHQIASVDFGRSPDRSASLSPRKDLDVGPGQYDVNQPRNQISYSFSKGELKPQYSDTPGPGHYNLPSKFAEVPSYVKMNQSDEFKYV